MSELKKRAILIGAGELTNGSVELIKKGLSENDYIIALDGGLAFCAACGIKPDRIVGDFDSLPSEKQELLGKYPCEIINRLPCEKDDTDTLAAIRMAEKLGYETFCIYGGLGGRLSHTLANIQSLMYLKERGLYGELIGDNSRIFLIKDECVSLDIQEKGYISVFAYSERAVGVTIRNLKYEVENAELTNSFPIGVSNEFVGKGAEISVEKGILLIVIEK